MSRTTVLLVGLMLVGLIASPALAQTTVTFRDQHIVPEIYEDTPDPTISNFSHLIQYDLFHPDAYWRAARQHIDRYDGWSMAIPNGATDYNTPLMEFDAMFGSDTTMYDSSYVGQVPHGAVVHSAVITMWRTGWGTDAENVSVCQVMDPDDLGHWGVNTDDPSWDPAGNGYKLGAGYFTRNSYPDEETDVLWDSQGTEEDPTTLRDILAAPDSTLDWWYAGSMYSETWTM
ncbi:MAG: hypothetical protein KAV00_13400, partial [Phycisphaerae bacterium]|nr:hypothetical protein [Phycisphaerae bacterium]